MRKGWEYKKLGEVCCPKSKIQRATKCFGGSDEILYIDISSIDNSVQEVNSITSFTMSNAPSRAQQKVEYGDIIVSTVRPNLKNVAFIKQHDSNLVVSSGFCVLRTTDDIERNYLFRYITSDIFTQHLMKLTTGANYPAVRDLDVRDSTIPLPPKSTQIAIVSELDKINELIRLKKEQLKDFDNLAQSLFYEMFGDPVENEKGWEVKKLGEIGEFKNGLNFSKDENGHSIKFLGVSDFQNKKSIASDQLAYISLSERVQEDYLLKTGDIVFVRSNGKKELIGRSVKMYITEPTTYSGFCIRCRITDEKVDKDYIAILLKTPIIRQFMTNSGRGCNISNLNQKVLNSIPTILPPLSLQRLFAQRIEQIEREKSEVQKSIQDLETLLASRMQYWFE